MLDDIFAGGGNGGDCRGCVLLFPRGDVLSFEATQAVKAVLLAAKTRGLALYTAESCTGGMFGAALTGVAGASDVFQMGFICYSNQAKMDVLGVGEATLTQFGAVSEQCAKEMATGCFGTGGFGWFGRFFGQIRHRHSPSRVSQDPAIQTINPKGRVCFAIATSAGARCQTQEFGAIGRDNVRGKAVLHGLDLLLLTING